MLPGRRGRVGLGLVVRVLGLRSGPGGGAAMACPYRSRGAVTVRMPLFRCVTPEGVAGQGREE
ncbi:hypothetical protein SCATT_31880 [Streptantibioticus cattleyicolor NRRL 8057 = DSM 46488]|uniref:Uncharacterized protein n=1 Tax=Streptantibioticus cattleyicolor (strain ATCC 35852 / DSM 46488 / JCM 4925 / NBRC 14057 / NRRL 8057) TaxID=1003195 RepID=G8WZV8_STREN|nr:hypothetical protein SCATT_31880 [Streptantibioticus cattleyicolor NRRL 8057 = DSM 46488]